MGGIGGQLLPVLKGAQLGSEYDIISYRFQYPSMWDRETKFYREMEKLLIEGTASFKLIGGMPLKEPYITNLKNLQEKGAEVRILKEPPTSHVFIHQVPMEYIISNKELPESEGYKLLKQINLPE